MAISLIIEQPSGVSASYWAISSYGVDYASGQVTVNLNGYVNQASFSNGNTALAHITERFALDEFTGEPTCADMYKLVAALENWQGAVIL